MKKWKIAVLVILVLGGVLAARALFLRKVESPFIDTDPASVDESVRESRKELEKTRQELLETAREVDPEMEEIPEPFSSFFGFDGIEEELDRFQEAARNIRVTESDLEGIEAYMRSDFPRAERLFRRSLDRNPDREFPLYYIGACLFEQGRYGEAGRFFRKTVEVNLDCRNAFFLAELSAEFEKNPAKDLPAMAVSLDRAQVKTMEKLGLERGTSLASVFHPPLASDPVLFRTQSLLEEPFTEKALMWLEKGRKASDPRQAAACLLLGLPDEKLADAALTALAEDHPDHLFAQAVSFFYRQYIVLDEDASSESFRRGLERLIRLDPENGLLQLLRIPEKVDEEFQPIPLEDSEMKIFREAVRAKHFDPLLDSFHMRIEELMRKELGGLAAYYPPSAFPVIISRIKDPLFRVSARIRRYLREGQRGEAEETRAVLLSLEKRVRSVGDPFISEMTADFAFSAAIDPFLEYVSLDEIDEAFADFLKKKEKAVHLHLYQRKGLSYVTEVPKIPLQSIRRIAGSSEGIAEATRRVYDEKKKRMREEWMEEALEGAESTLKSMNSEYPSMDYDALLLARVLRVREALPILKQLERHPDVFCAYLARKAVRAIEGE